MRGYLFSQSLEIYDERGKAVHERIPEGEPVWISDTDKREPWRVPAKSKRVVEYLVFEKRAWVNGPWQFREQMW
jgi:protein MBA1